MKLKSGLSPLKKTAQITNAMRMVSAAKYNKMAQDAKDYFLYAEKVRKMVSHVAKSQLELLDDGVPIRQDGLNYIDFHDMLLERPVKKTGYLIISSDRGLAGSYNSSIIKAVQQMFEEDHADKSEVVVLAIGEPIAKFCRENGYYVAKEMHDISADQPSVRYKPSSSGRSSSLRSRPLMPSMSATITILTRLVPNSGLTRSCL